MASQEGGAPPTGETRAVGGGLTLDIGYVKSIPGILTLAITIVSLIAFICVYAGRGNAYFWVCEALNYGGFNFFGFVSMTAFLTGLIHFILFLLMIYQKLQMIPWHLATLIWCAVWALLYLISSAIVVAKACGGSAIIAGGIFGFLAMLLLAAKAYFAFMDWRGKNDAPPPSSTDPPPQYPPQY